jgi:D-alanyl-lipoteichoic acid acyltransferase DltB (MBOAT superfamily)
LTFVLTTVSNSLTLASIQVDIPTPNLLLPVGISFYTFEAISYVTDVYKCRFHARQRWLDFNYFIVFFPKLTAGPIIRPQNFFDNIANDKPMSATTFEKAFQRIFIGLFQKVVLADTFSIMADKVFGNTGGLDSVTTLIGIYAFALQIYFDFVGYTNIAIGSAGLLGINLPDNFRRPYIATCLSDFWKRWHISLSSWLRDYLYIPIGGGRGSLPFICRNLMITMTLGGLWHGASWNFAIWGALNGALLCFERAFQIEMKVNAWLGGRGMSWRLAWSVLTFQVFALLWIPFRAHTFSDFTRVVGDLFSLSLPRELTVYELVIGAAALITLVFCVIDERFDLQTQAAKIHPLVKAPVFAALVIVSIGFSNEGNQPFIYFRF